MSYKTQVALGKNTTLQRKLEDKFVEFKRNLKCTRRHYDKLEEDCLTALYKLIVDAKGADSGDKGGNDKQSADPRRSKSANPTARREQPCIDTPLRSETSEGTKRPVTSMSGRDYRQSYSFRTSGLNIDKSRRDRYIRNKKQKEDKAIEIRRGNVHWATKGEVDDRPKTAMTSVGHRPDSDFSHDEGDKPPRPFTADPYQSTGNGRGQLLQRPQMKNAKWAITQRTETQHVQPLGVSTSTVNHNGEASTMNRYDDSKTLLEDTQTHMSLTDGSEPPLITVKVTLTKLNDAQEGKTGRQGRGDTARPVSRVDFSSAEDDLVSLCEDDKNHLESIMGEHTHGRRSVDGAKSRPSKSPRPGTRSGKHSVLSKTPTPEDVNVVETAIKTQTFLTSYAKKSKLLGYVVKTRSSSAAPREKSTKTYRSPCVTYQELVSIKANIKQQESRTRLLLQRSAKLAKYVDKLANAGNVRRYLASQNEKQPA